MDEPPPMMRPGPRPPGSPWVTCGCLVVMAAVLVVILFPVFARPRAKACQNNCLSNVKQLMLGTNMYASDNGHHFPPAADWPQRIYPYVKNTQIFVCPNDEAPRRYPQEPREQSYTMNMRANELRLDEVGNAAELGVLFDGDAVYGRAEAGAFRHNQGLYLAYADGHCKWMSEKDFVRLRLAPEGRP